MTDRATRRSRLRGLHGLGGAAVLALALPVGAQDPGKLPPLQFDPFSPRTERADLGQGPAPFTPVLRATLVSEDGALANLGGRILRVGEASHGYRLLAVREGEAEFETETGGRVVLELVAPREEED